jgi:hypothetical protein
MKNFFGKKIVISKFTQFFFLLSNYATPPLGLIDCLRLASSLWYLYKNKKN